MDWYPHIEALAPYLVKIETPHGHGTGFIIETGPKGFVVATAAHVLRDADTWGLRIILEHPSSGASLGVLKSERTISLHPVLDSAWLRVQGHFKGNPIPEVPVELVPSGHRVAPGAEVGWLGFPYLVPVREPSFFFGHVSAYYAFDGRYFIDGVAIKGVSGGPAFIVEADGAPAILGSVAAYVSGGEALPGLMVAETIAPLDRIRKRVAARDHSPRIQK